MTERKEIGVIPYFEKNGVSKFVIITTLGSKSRWIFPKGQPEPDMKDDEVAVNEAFEEAGVIGTIREKPVKIKFDTGRDVIIYKLYPFKVSKICRNWPEKNRRTRKYLKESDIDNGLLKHTFYEALKEYIRKRDRKK